MNNLRFIFGIIITLELSACADYRRIKELDKQIAAKRTEMTQVSNELNLSAASSKLNINNDLYAAVRYTPITQWLQEITTPQYRISGVGLEVHGDIVYKGGTGKAWLEPARDSKVLILLKGFGLNGTQSSLNWSGRLASEFETRVKFEVYHVGSNIKCDGHTNDTMIAGSLTVGSVSEDKVPYQLNLTTPSNVSVAIACHLGGLGDYKESFKINDLARYPSKGDISLGFSKTGDFQLPKKSGGKKFTYFITSKQPAFSLNSLMMEFRSDVSIVVKPN